MLDGERLTIKTKVHVLSGYSGHVDQKGVLEWLGSVVGNPGRMRLVHGEPAAQKAFSELLRHHGYAVASSSWRVGRCSVSVQARKPGYQASGSARTRTTSFRVASTTVKR